VRQIDIPEWVSGLIGIVLLALALADSLRQHRQQQNQLEAS